MGLKALVVGALVVAVARGQGRCNVNADCEPPANSDANVFCNYDEGWFDGVFWDGFCEFCYYPGDLALEDDGCGRYLDRCCPNGPCTTCSACKCAEDAPEDGEEEDDPHDGEGECCSWIQDVPRFDCVENPEGRPADRGGTPLDPNPTLTSLARQFPEGAATCGGHATYGACQGETGERCQWVFVNGGGAGGFCRVDPVSKCLEIGDCQCTADDFLGGGDIDGILFHVPVSATARDVAPVSRVASYAEAAATPVVGTDVLHPRDESFFVSRVDFTAKSLTYALSGDFGASSTLTAKVHHLYRDQWLEGTVYAGPGLTVGVATATAPVVVVNGVDYAFPPAALKTWHCNQLAVTPTAVHLRGFELARDLDAETPPATTDVALGPFSGELFDVRVYAGSLSPAEIKDVGAKCGDPGDARMLTHLETPFLRAEGETGCDPDIDAVPDDGGIQTYGSGAFATLWVAPFEYGGASWPERGCPEPHCPATPELDDPVVGTYYDMTEDVIDLDRYFQEQKMQNYAWERFLFEADQIANNVEPFAWYPSAAQVPGWSAKVWNNPCRYLHQNNNGWMYPFYGGAIPKWDPTGLSESGPSDPVDGLVSSGVGFEAAHAGVLAPNAGAPGDGSGGAQAPRASSRRLASSDADVAARRLSSESFDLRTFFYGRGHAGYGFVVHEAFHGVQGELSGTYESGNSRWHAESTASFGADLAFPATDTYAAPYVVAPGVPLNFFFDREVPEVSGHFMAMGYDWGIRGGHIYASFLFWSFLANHARMPGMSGRMESARPRLMQQFGTGELLALRAFMHAEGKDLGDVFANFVAHLRTVDLPPFSDGYAAQLQNSFDGYAGPRRAGDANACPLACDECQWWDCADFADWHAVGDATKDCAWVAENPEDRCDTEGVGIFGDATLEDAQTTVSVTGDTDGFVAGPPEQRPGPFAWNAIKIELGGGASMATVEVKWDDLSVDADAEALAYGTAVNPHDLNALHARCVDDDRFFAARLVRVNPDGTRSYWKLDGARPPPVTVETLGGALHLLVVPTPPADYVNDYQRGEGTDSCTLCWREPVPAYGYAYSVFGTDFGETTPPAALANDVLAFADATDAPWFADECTCTQRDGGLDSCVAPRFASVDSAPTPTAAPAGPPGDEEDGAPEDGEPEEEEEEEEEPEDGEPEEAEEDGAPEDGEPEEEEEEEPEDGEPEEAEEDGAPEDGEPDQTPSPTLAPTTCDDPAWVATKDGFTCTDIANLNEDTGWDKKKSKKNCRKYKSEDKKKAKKACDCYACDKKNFQKKKKNDVTEGSVVIIVPVVIAAILLVGAILALARSRFRKARQHRRSSMPTVSETRGNQIAKRVENMGLVGDDP